MNTPKTDAFRDRIPDPIAVQQMLASHGDLERRTARYLAAMQAILAIVESEPMRSHDAEIALDRIGAEAVAACVNR